MKQAKHKTIRQVTKRVVLKSSRYAPFREQLKKILRDDELYSVIDLRMILHNLKRGKEC